MRPIRPLCIIDPGSGPATHPPVREVAHGLDDDERSTGSPRTGIVAGDLPILLAARPTLTVVGDGPEAMIESAGTAAPAAIVEADRQASNGYVQGVDQILVPAGLTLP